MILDTILGSLNTGDVVYDIGQIDKETKRALDKMVRGGEVVRTKALWPWFDAGMARKTAYVKPR